MSKSKRGGEHVPERIDVAAATILRIGKEPCPLIVDRRDSRKGGWNGDLHAEKICQFPGDGLSIGVRHTAIERGHGRKRTDIGKRAGTAVRKAVLEHRHRHRTCRDVVDALDKRTAVVPVVQKFVGNCPVQPCPGKRRRSPVNMCGIHCSSFVSSLLRRFAKCRYAFLDENLLLDHAVMFIYLVKYAHDIRTAGDPSDQRSSRGADRVRLR